MSAKSRLISLGFICVSLLIGSLVLFTNERSGWARAAERIPVVLRQNGGVASARPLGGAVTIDSFVTEQAAIALNSPADVGLTKTSFVNGPGVLGSERDLAVTLLKGGVGNNGVEVQIVDGVYSLSQDPTVEAKSEIQWDGADGSMNLNPTGLGVQDLTSGSVEDAIKMQVLFDDMPVDLD